MSPDRNVQKIADIIESALNESGMTISATNGNGTWFEVALGDGYVQIEIEASGDGS